MNRNFIIIIAVIFCNAVGMVLPILGTLFFNDLNLSVETIGLIMSFWGIGGLLGGYIGGHVADYINPKNVVSVSLLGNGVFIVLLGIFKDITLLSLCMLCTGFCNASFRSPSLLLLLKANNKLSDLKLFSIRRIAINLGFAIASFSFGYLYNYYEKASFIFIGLFFALAFLLSLSLKTHHKYSAKMQEDKTIKKPNFKLFALLNIFLIICITVLCQYSSTYTLFLENVVELSILDISRLFAFHAVLIIVFQIPISYLCDKITLSMSCFVGALFLAFGMGLTGFASNLKLAILFCTIWTVGEMILQPLSLVFILKISTFKKGKTIGIFQASVFLGLFLSPLFGSFFYKISPYLLWKVCFLTALICALFYLMLYKFYEKAPSNA
jgi:MFS family permease